MNVTLDTWIISDTHFGHDNIIKFCGRPEDHDRIMWNNWLASIRIDEDVLHLGDIQAWRKPASEKWQRVLPRLPGNKFYIKGNHDKVIPSGWEQVGKLLGEFVEEDVTRDGVPYRNTIKNHGFYWHTPQGKRILFSHYPDAWLLDWTTNIHGHIHNNPYSPKISSARDYRNVSAEVMGYKPVRLGEILDKSRPV
jgi:calcineurin-like phosphoesterase family protein